MGSGQGGHIEVNRSIQKLIQRAQRLKTDPLRRARIIDGLKYLHGQSLCSSDRKHPDFHIRACFKSVEENAMHTDLVRDPAWLGLKSFVGEVATTQKFADWDAVRFFDYLSEKVRRERPLRADLNTELFFTLTVLRDQAKLVRYQRDYKIIQSHWRRVRALTDGTAFFAEFQGERKLSGTIRSFVRQYMV